MTLGGGGGGGGGAKGKEGMGRKNAKQLQEDLDTSEDQQRAEAWGTKAGERDGGIRPKVLYCIERKGPIENAYNGKRQKKKQEGKTNGLGVVSQTGGDGQAPVLKGRKEERLAGKGEVLETQRTRQTGESERTSTVKGPGKKTRNQQANPHTQ